MNKIDEIALRVAVQHGIRRNGEQCFDDSELIDFAHALLAELSKDAVPLCHAAMLDQWFLAKSGLDPELPLFTHPVMPDQSEVDSLRKDADNRMTVIDIADDDALRFVQRVLESQAPEADRQSARDMIVAIRTRFRRNSAATPDQSEIEKRVAEAIVKMIADEDVSETDNAIGVVHVIKAKVRHGKWREYL